MGNKIFILPPNKRNISDEELLLDLRKVAGGYNKNSITFNEYDKKGIVRARTIMVRFNGWNNALIKAGLVISRIKDIKDEELFDEILRIWIKKGKSPSREDLIKYDCKYGRTTYERRFGSWRKALEVFVTFANEQNFENPNNETKIDNKHKTSRFPNLSQRFNVLKKANFKCENCGRGPATTQGLELHVDHYIPYSKGGETVRENLICLCSECNLGKSDK